MSPRHLKNPPGTTTAERPSPRWLALVPKEEPPPPAPPATIPPPLSAEEEMYARAALACYTKALATEDPDLVTNLLEAGAWFARLGNHSDI